MSKKRRTYKPEEKANIVLEILREESTVNEIAQVRCKPPVNLEGLGFTIGLKLTRRYMQEMDIAAFYPGPNLSKRDLKERTYPTSFGMLASPIGIRFGGLILCMWYTIRFYVSCGYY